MLQKLNLPYNEFHPFLILEPFAMLLDSFLRFNLHRLSMACNYLELNLVLLSDVIVHNASILFSFNRTRNQESSNLVGDPVSMSTLSDVKLQAATCDMLTVANGKINFLV